MLKTERDSTGAIVVEDYKEAQDRKQLRSPYNHIPTLGTQLPLKTSTTASYMLVHLETTAFSREGGTTAWVVWVIKLNVLCMRCKGCTLTRRA